MAKTIQEQAYNLYVAVQKVKIVVIPDIYPTEFKCASCGRVAPIEIISPEIPFGEWLLPLLGKKDFFNGYVGKDMMFYGMTDEALKTKIYPWWNEIIDKFLAQHLPELQEKYPDRSLNRIHAEILKVWTVRISLHQGLRKGFRRNNLNIAL